MNKDTNIQSIKAKFSSLFQHFNDKAVKLLRKGIFPSDYMDEDWENELKEKKTDIKYFYSSLNNTKCLTNDYNYGQETYDYYEYEEIIDYNDSYVKTDVLLLGDVLIAYRQKIYGFDPLCCILAPGFSNRAMLKMTNIEIKLITSVDMQLIIQDGIKGGKFEPTNYHAKANNKHVNPNFNKYNEKESYIISLDLNSMYTSAMCYKLPYSEPKLDHNISKYTTVYILNLDPYGQHLFGFVMDIHYPKTFQDRDFEFPILCDQAIPL